MHAKSPVFIELQHSYSKTRKGEGVGTINAIERCQPHCRKLDFEPEVDSKKSLKIASFVSS